MPCMLLLPVQDRGCEVKQAAAHLSRHFHGSGCLHWCGGSLLGIQLWDSLRWRWDKLLCWPWGVSGTRRPAGPASCCASHGISTFIPYFIPSATKEFFLPEACGPCFTVNPAGSFVCIEWCLLASPKRVLRMQTETSGLMLRSCSC